MKADLFQSCGHWVFQVCWRNECGIFTPSSFRIWNSSTGIPSSPLSLFIVMLPKAHLTSYSRMSGSRLVTTPSWLSRSLRPFLCSYSAYSCYLFLIFSASVKFLTFLSFINPILTWKVPLISPLEEVNLPTLLMLILAMQLATRFFPPIVSNLQNILLQITIQGS